ncbi:protein CIP2A-like, partial [Anneissia japonica]|uniref:protein CIP2A-like n=1 Tax=Anneissia japonica TaxID=1529436 RepID=UPI0014255457
MNSTVVIKSVIQASNQFKNNASDHNMLQLQKQLDVLISMTSRGKSLKFFAPHQMIPTDCLTCLMAILNDGNSPTELSSKTIILLFNLAADKDIREALQSTFNVSALLAAFLKQYRGSPTDQVILQ